MGVSWNPSFPNQIGIERRNVNYDQFSVNTMLAMHGLQFRARHSGATSNISLFTGQGAAAAGLGPAFNNLFQPIVVDLYPASGAPWVTGQSVQLSTFTPTAVTGSSGMLNENLSQPITASRLQGQTDGSYIFAVSPGENVRVQFATDTFPLDRRIRQVCLVLTVNAPAVVRRYDPGGVPVFGFGLTPTSSPRTLSFMGEAITLFGDTAWRWWTPQMIRDFRSGGPMSWYVEAYAVPTAWILDYVELQVYWEPERRIGVGIRAPNFSFTETSFDMKSPAGTGTPSLTSGQDYAMVCRRPEPDSIFGVGGAVFPWRRLKGSLPVTGWQSVPITAKVPIVSGSVDGVGVIAVQAASPTPSTSDIMCMRMVTGGPAGLVVETTQPYQLSRPVEVYQGKILEQEFTVTGAGTTTPYGQTTAIVGWLPGALPRFTPIRAEVWTATGAPEVQVFSPVERTFEFISSLPVTAEFSVAEGGQSTRLVRFRHSQTRTLPTGTYKIIISAGSTPASTPWFVETLISDGHTTDQTFQRLTGKANGTWTDGTFAGTPLTGTNPTSGKTFSSDLQVTLATVPPAVTGFGVAVGVTTAHHADTCVGQTCTQGGCADEGAPFNQLTWSAADSTTLFYEVQRNDELDPVFRTVALVRGRFNTRWSDYEARIGVRSCYRVRSMHPDDIAGDWSSEVCSTPPQGIVALTFTSNAATGLSLTYPEVWNGSPITRSWAFQEYDDMEFHKIHGRDGQAMFHRIERTGVTFSRTLLLNAICSVNPPTMGMFSPVRALSWAAIPYVCVRDGEGNRWFAAIQVPTGTNIRSGEQWYIDVTITELVKDPAIADTGVSQPEPEIVL